MELLKNKDKKLLQNLGNTNYPEQVITKLTIKLILIFILIILFS